MILRPELLPLALLAVFIAVVPSADERAHASEPCGGDCADLCGASPVLVVVDDCPAPGACVAVLWEYDVAACADDDMRFGPVPFGETPAFCPVEVSPMCLPREWVGCVLVRRRA